MLKLHRRQPCDRRYPPSTADLILGSKVPGYLPRDTRTIRVAKDVCKDFYSTSPSPLIFMVAAFQ